MGIFEILFVVINLAVPAYFITRASSTAPKVNWDSLEKSMIRLIDSDGGFPGCSTLGLMSTLEEMCEKSRDKMKPGQTVVIERASREVVFSCEYSATSVRISWRLENSKEADLSCGDPGGEMAPHAPGFVFALNGRMRAFEFSDNKGQRQSIPARNCRSKAVQLQNHKPPLLLDELFAQMSHMPGDPPDYLTANFVCFVFDFSPLWHNWRVQYPR